jgi:hypothetical protein
VAGAIGARVAVEKQQEFRGFLSMAQMNGFEKLEDRVLMAGNVTAVVSGGNLLTITGDDAANDIQIYTQLGASGTTELVIVGRNGTTVNAGAEATILTGVVTAGIEDITIDLGKGNDVLDVNGLFGLNSTADNTLTVNGGFGGDLLSIADVNLPNFDLTVTGPASVITSPDDLTDNDGNDVVSIGARQDLVVLDSITITDVVGSNQVYITDAEVADTLTVDLSNTTGILTTDTSVAYLSNVTVGLGTTITTGNAADTIIVNDSTLTGALSISAGGQNDNIEIHGSLLGTVAIDGGVGTDQQNVYESIATTIAFTNGTGGSSASPEYFGVYNTSVTSSVSVTTGVASSGNDVFVTDRLFLTGPAAALAIDLGDGDDTVYQINSGAYGTAIVSLLGGDGNDSVGLNNVSYASGTVAFVGGLGNDQLSIGGGSSLGVVSAVDSNGTNGFFLTDSTIRSGLTVNAAGATQNTVYTARLKVLGGATSIVGGDQVDNIQILDGTILSGSTFSLTTGNSNDSVVVNNASFRYSGGFATDLGAGDDTYAANGSRYQVGGLFSFDGGTGTNTGTGTGNTKNLAPSITNFGTFSPL